MDSDGVGALGFWIFIAAMVIGGIWADARKKAEKHETLRRIVEKTGTIDEAKLRELFKEEPAVPQKPGGGYRALRILGTIIMSIGAGFLTCFLVVAGLLHWFGVAGPFKEKVGMFAAFGACAGIAVFGLGVFFSSRFAQRPDGARNEPPAR